MADEREAALQGKSQHREIVSKEIRNRNNRASEGDWNQRPTTPVENEIGNLVVLKGRSFSCAV